MKTIRTQKRKGKKKRLKSQLVTRIKFEKNWKARPIRTFSKYPYIITFSQYRRNIFLTISDFKGRIKQWTSVGAAGYKNREKVDYLAVSPVVREFFKRAKKRKLRVFFLRFKHIRRSRSGRTAFKNVLKSFVKRSRSKYFKVLGCWSDLHIAFNGCRPKKKRRKRKYRRPRRIYKKLNFKTIIYHKWKRIERKLNSRKIRKNKLN